ncbi:glypican-6 [Frankliniella occidentalis]|uniref:Glypican-6 n=1 Tax=Frankliniella occidentalis TaxID=133901 RepID=A0A6J1SCI4_FRAOC|nr:glypican-6 [Frankliniella occidentalis]
MRPSAGGEEVKIKCVSKCAWKMRISSLVVLALAALVAQPALAATIPKDKDTSDISCSSLRYTYEEKGISVGDVPSNPLTGTHLRVCAQGMTCCTEQMEVQLKEQSKVEYDKAVKDALAKMATLFKTRANKFDDYFNEMLANSKREFHDMFKRTYGMIYEQHSYVFTDLFDQLERYYAKGGVDLEDALDTFFNTLYQKMFTVLNQQYHFDDKYLACVGDHMKDLKPFGEVPNKLTNQLKRSFVATRTFSQSLSRASEIITKMANIDTSPDCARAVMKMTYCPACQGLPELKACSNYCINVMKGCLAYQAELDVEWNKFIKEIGRVIDRLLNPFNIQKVVEPIDIKISEAIMNFQEDGPQVSEKVFSGCGRPTLQGSRKRRDTRSKRDNHRELNFESLKFGPHRDNYRGSTANADPGQTQGPTLEKIIKDIRQKIMDTQNFWSNLPYQICNDKASSKPDSDDNCWNGAMKARYELQITGNGMNNQRSNPEVAVDQKPSSLLNEQLFHLRTLTSNLNAAYNGRDVQWLDNENDESLNGSGSGSGDGIGSEDDDVRHEGSGSAPPHNHDDLNFGSVPELNGNVSPAEKGTVVEDVHQPSYPTHNTEDNNLHPSSGLETNALDDGVVATRSNTTAGGSGHQEMSITRAVISYLFPIFVCWVGSNFSDLL